MTQTGNQNIHFEIKSQLAKLLATENITVQHKTNVSTAMFDVKDRILTLPVWQNISEDLYDMLVVHEVGHALDTPCEGWKEAVENIANKHHDNAASDSAKSAVRDFLNVIEDARIDKRQKRRYPGSKRNYLAGYKELNDRNFFGINGKELSSLSFIDRINLYFKTIGIHIQFSSEEKSFIHRISNAETFDEVIQLTDEIYAYAKQKHEEQKSQTAQNDLNEETEEGEEDESRSESIPDQSDTDDTELSDSKSFDSDDALDSEDDEDFEEDESDIQGQETSAGESDGDDVPQSITEQAARKSLETIVRSDDIDYVYCHIPKFNLTNVIDDYTKVLADLDEYKFYTNPYYNPHYNAFGKDLTIEKFREWKRKENDTISFMVKEFEMKKAADYHSRITVSKTGVIDTNKLHAYKYNEDIFRRLSVLPQGKNHGFVMVLDWSGSMVDNLEATVKQLISLTMFCKRVQIPFEVYLFRNANYQERETIQKNGGLYEKKNGAVQFGEFKLRNILSSRMNAATLNKAYEYLHFLSFNRVGCDIMDSTPLNQAIIALEEIVNNFQRKNKLQIVNTIILTDGSSDPTEGVYFDQAAKEQYVKDESFKRRKVYILRDEKTKRTYVTDLRWNETTTTLLKILKTRTGCNLIGFYLNNGPLRNLTHIADYTWLQLPEVVKVWKDDKFLALTNQGYDEYYVLNTTRRGNNVSGDLNINADMTKAKIAKEFIRFSEKKTINRVLLSKFISRVSATQV